jgi:hypothetical protein
VIVNFHPAFTHCQHPVGAHDGAKAAAVASADGSLQHNFEAGKDHVWSDMRVQVVFSPVAPQPPADAVAAFYVATNGQVMAFSNGSAVATGKTVTEGTWVRYTTFADYGVKQWKLYVDGDPCGDYAFFNDSRSSFEEFGVQGDLPGLDNVSLTTDRPVDLPLRASLILVK